MKQYVGETESNWRFWKNVKTCLRNIKVYLGTPSRHGHFHLLLILPVKMVELRSNMPILSIGCIPLCKFLSLPIVAKSSILNVTDLLDPPLKNSPCMKTSPDSCETIFFKLFWNVAHFIQSRCIFLLLWQYDEVFLGSLLVDESSQWLFKVTITCKIAIFI